MPSSAANLTKKWVRNANASVKRLALKERAIAHMGGQCAICSYSKTPSALVFHHLDPDGKDFNISHTSNWDRVVAELKKCALVCTNCHAEIHAGLHPAYLTLHD